MYLGVDSIDPASDGKDVDHGEEVSFELLEAYRQTSHVLHGTEEAFNDVSPGVEAGVMWYRVVLVAL